MNLKQRRRLYSMLVRGGLCSMLGRFGHGGGCTLTGAMYPRQALRHTGT